MTTPRPADPPGAATPGAATGSLSPWAGRTLADLLEANGLSGIVEEPFPNDGWSGARLTSLSRAGRRFILKRTLMRLETQWHGLERLTYYVLFPMFLIQTLVKADLDKVPVAGVGGT
jgi:hypothetical protein